MTMTAPAKRKRSDPLAGLKKVMSDQIADAVNSSKVFAFGSVTAQDGLGGSQVLFDKETIPSVKFYRALGSGAAIGDRVMLARTGVNRWVILGSLGGYDTGWMTQTTNPGLVMGYSGVTTCTSYAVRRIGKTVYLQAVFTINAMQVANTSTFAFVGQLNPSIAGDYNLNWPMGSTGYGPQGTFEVSGTYLVVLTWTGGAMLNSTLTISGTYRCP